MTMSVKQTGYSSTAVSYTHLDVYKRQHSQVHPHYWRDGQKTATNIGVWFQAF